MLRTLLFICISIICGISILKAQTNFSDFKTLEGLWRIESSFENSFEEWKYISDTMMLGSGFSINKNDTIVNEFLSLNITKKGCFYSAKVLKQNNSTEIVFKLIEQKNKIFVFENNKHDFPKRITYNISDKNIIIATIEDETKRFNIIMKRIF